MSPRFIYWKPYNWPTHHLEFSPCPPNLIISAGLLITCPVPSSSQPIILLLPTAALVHTLCAWYCTHPVLPGPVLLLIGNVQYRERKRHCCRHFDVDYRTPKTTETFWNSTNLANCHEKVWISIMLTMSTTLASTISLAKELSVTDYMTQHLLQGMATKKDDKWCSLVLPCRSAP